MEIFPESKIKFTPKKIFLDKRCQKVLNSGMKSHEVSGKVVDEGKASVKVGSLLGSYPHRLDPKRRVTIPAVLRSRMGMPDIVYVMPSLSGRNCLEVFSPEAFEMRLYELNKAALTDEAYADFVTLIGRVSETLDVDVQGRIRISDALLEHIGVARDVVIVGALNRLQVWAAGNEPSLNEAFDRLTQSARAIKF